jgi:hypothetical protein
MVDGVRDRRVDADVAEPAQAFAAERVNPVVRFGTRMTSIVWMSAFTGI